MENCLAMPRNFVPVKDEEMEYVDGGYTVFAEGIRACIKFSGSETNKILANSSYIISAISIGVAFASPLASAIAWAVLSLYESRIKNYNSNNSGFTLIITPGSTLPSVRDNY